MLRPLAKKSHVELRLASSEPEAELDADAGQIEQVLTNLIVNGIHAMPEGGELTVSIDEVDAKNSRHVRLQVTDHGTGIPQENLERIFEPFFTTRDVGVGTGLGLSVAHGIVRDHGGWIDVESVPTKGSTFSVYLPRGAAS
jgi:signal transduction histidine kinase